MSDLSPTPPRYSPVTVDYDNYALLQGCTHKGHSSTGADYVYYGVPVIRERSPGTTLKVFGFVVCGDQWQTVPDEKNPFKSTRNVYELIPLLPDDTDGAT